VKPLAERLKAKATSFVELERGMLPELKAVTH
jgi:hypothetical protein